MNPAQPGIVTAEQLAELVNVFLPDSDLSTDIRAEQARTKDRINWKLYVRMVKLHPENLALVRQLRNHEINEAEYRRRKRLLFYKLMGDYNAAIVILREGLALDLRLFHRIFSSDTTRMALFSSFAASGISHDDFVLADQARVTELMLTYGEALVAKTESGETIEDISPKLI